LSRARRHDRCAVTVRVVGSGGWFVFFFFQAEDGIRDFHVTGVQTCALPIFSATTCPLMPNPPDGTVTSFASVVRSTMPMPSIVRSEERRVGKECRARGWPYD